MPIEDAANLLAAVAITALMFLGVAQIVMRTVINNPIDAYIDLVELSIGSHIPMELLMSRLSGRGLSAVEAIGAALAMFITGVLAYCSYGHFSRAYTLGDTTIDAEYVTWPSKLLVPISFSIW